MILNKKAAMFGLDARIALAIFGALSVISGAALYSAIQQAKATSLLVEMREVGKAWEQYYLDTGENLPKNNTSSSDSYFYALETQYFVNKPTGVNGWNGPYLPYEANGYNLSHPTYVNVNLRTLAHEDTWNAWTAGKCTTGKECSLWVYFNGVDSIEVAKAIDIMIDGVDDSSNGDFRWLYADDGLKVRTYLKYAPIKNPND
tara:strand:- start:2210 stop:2815 length:606 start_codon:yes stop_codon:yes gene_type:complete